MSKLTTKQLTIFVFSMLIVLFAELTIFQNGGAILLVITGLALYYGYTKKKRLLIWTGLLFLFLSCITLITVRILVLLLLVYALYRFAYKQEEVIETDKPNLRGVVYPNKSLLEFNSPTDSYKWQDMLIERFIGDVTIDVTQTVLPAGKSIISVRQTFGQVRVIVPYEVNIQFHVTTMYGEVSYDHSVPKRLINESFVMNDVDEEVKRTLVIYVSSKLTDVEVTRG